MESLAPAHVPAPPKQPLEANSVQLFSKYGIGYQLLNSMGWSAGDGLGKKQEGLVAPVATTQVTQVGSRGLGFTSAFAAISQGIKRPRVVVANDLSFCELCFAVLTKDNSGAIERELGSQNRMTGQITGDATCNVCTEIEEAEEKQQVDEKKYIRIRNLSARRLYIELTGWVGENHVASWRPETNTEIYEAVLVAAQTEEEQRAAEQTRQLLAYEEKKKSGLLVEEDIFDVSSEPEPKKEPPKLQKPLQQKPLLQKREEVRGAHGPSKKAWQKPKRFFAGLGWVEEEKIDADGHVFEEEVKRILEEAKATATTSTTSTKPTAPLSAPMKASSLKISQTPASSTTGGKLNDPKNLSAPMTAKIKLLPESRAQRSFVDLT